MVIVNDASGFCIQICQNYITIMIYRLVTETGYLQSRKAIIA